LHAGTPETRQYLAAAEGHRRQQWTFGIGLGLLIDRLMSRHGR
jgi:hypothetical protein